MCNTAWVSNNGISSDIATRGQGARNAIPVGFTLWFNLFAGFAYVAVGVGPWMQRRWSGRIALAIAAATVPVFAAFGIHLAAGGAFEARTAWAMALHSGIWVPIAVLAFRALKTPGLAPARAN